MKQRLSIVFFVILAFLLAFTFSISAARFDTRKQLVLDEATTIWAAYQQAGLIAEPHRTEVRQLLRHRALDGALGDVTLAGRAEERQHPALRQPAGFIQDRAQRFRRVGVVHQHRERLPFIDSLHPPRNGVQAGQTTGNRSGA